MSLASSTSTALINPLRAHRGAYGHPAHRVTIVDATNQSKYW
jgi:hypothetical protein